MNGTVKWFNYSKGFGFIKTDGKDVFIHATDVTDGVELKEDQNVIFDLADSPKGKKAINLKVEV